MRNIYVAGALLLLCSVTSAQSFTGTWNPKAFIENKGQVVDQAGHPNDVVKYIYHDGFLNLALKPFGFSYEVFEVSREAPGYDEAGFGNVADQKEFIDHLGRTVRSHRVDVIFEGANHDIIPMASGAIEGYLNYIYAPVQRNQQLEVHAFTRITYPDLYPGIDLVFYAPDQAADTGLRYEFIVHPGADLSKISFRYEGADFSLLNSGSFLINTSFGFIEESRPRYFIEGISSGVDGSFRIKKNSKRFSALTYDQSKFLIIDPNIIWGTYYGGEKADEIAEIVVDSRKRPSIAGNTVSLTHIASTGAFQASFAGGNFDFFLASFKSTGALNWATYFGGIQKEDCYGLGIDNKDNLIVVGNSMSQGLATSGAYKDSLSNSQHSDILIAKFSASGALVWSTYYGGDAPENARNCVCDSKNNIYLSGTTSSSTGIAYGNAAQAIAGGSDDTWLAKFTQNGWPVWSTYYGGSGTDRAHAVSLDRFGNCFVGGTCNSITGIASPGAFHPNFSGGAVDAFLARYDTAGNFKWGTYIGGSMDDRTRGVECDSMGNAYIGGFTLSDTGVATAGSYHATLTPPSNGEEATEDAFLLKFNTDGKRQWGTYYGGDGTEETWGMTSDKKNHSVYIMGSTNSQDHVTYGSAMQDEKTGGEDGFLCRFHEDGSLEWATYWGGETGDQFEDAMPDGDGNLYVTGRTTSGTMPVTSNVYQANFYGPPSDATVYKFYIGSDCSDPFEPNESSAIARRMTPVPITDSTNWGWNGNIRNAIDQDWFTIKARAPLSNYMMILQDMPKDYNLKLHNHSGDIIYQSIHTGSLPDTIVANNLGDGTYYLEIAHNSTQFDSLGCYRLRLYSSTLPIVKESPRPDPVISGSLIIFPNPAYSEISFGVTLSSDETAGVVIYDMLERKVFAVDVNLIKGMQQINVPVNGLPAGPYQVVIMSGDHSWSGRFIKQ